MNQTLTILHPGVETDASQASPRMAPRVASLQGARLALLDNSKLNAGATLAAVGRLLQQRYGVAQVRAWKKRHAGETGAYLFPAVLDWKPDIALAALGD
jgi:hypothetical protein